MTAREALEQINGSHAFEELVKERTAERATEAPRLPPKRQELMGGAWLEEDGQTAVQPSRGGDQEQLTVTGPEAEKVADVPHLTGGAWPEWDELELTETDPTREKLQVRW